MTNLEVFSISGKFLPLPSLEIPLSKASDVQALGLPSVLTDVIMKKRGLVLFVGGTGTGKSTSLAALLGYRNRHQKGHILTIEDPIEFVHEHNKSIITNYNSLASPLALSCMGGSRGHCPLPHPSPLTHNQ